MSVAEAESRFGNLVQQVEGGEEIVITRDGAPVARLMGNEPKPAVYTEEQRAEARAGAEWIRKQAKMLPKEPFN